MTTIGYARKSKGKERTTTRCNLLTEMVHRLRTRSLCTKVYVSSYCNASQPLEPRDSKGKYEHHLSLIKNCDDDMTSYMNDISIQCIDFHFFFLALMQLLKTKFKPIRLAVIDFARLSTESNAVCAFIR
ncbi:hypothetical protein EDC96DRAFT_443291 [Choanephora cucurbitarum]|nr:hypothetical protein EDC96DRAFT_443291 [Choanephora cucurbitarum]